METKNLLIGSKKKFKFENLNPTTIEKKMFEYCGLYPIEYNSNTEYVKYATIHSGNKFKENYPTSIEISDENIDVNNSIDFYGCTENVEINLQNCDVEILNLILERCNELEWNMSRAKYEN